MKQSSRFLLPLILAGALNASVMAQMPAGEFERLNSGKITKNQAQHFALKKFPGANIKKCELRQGKQHSIWAVELVKPGEKTVTTVEVDGRTGKILP